MSILSTYCLFAFFVFPVYVVLKAFQGVATNRGVVLFAESYGATNFSFGGSCGSVSCGADLLLGILRCASVRFSQRETHMVRCSSF